MTNILLVAIGGAIGASLRFIISSAMGSGSVFGMHIPHSTIVINVLGSIAMGVLIGIFARYVSEVQNLHLFFAVGLLGSFTTFSTFSLDVVTMIERGDLTAAIIYISLSVFLSIIGLFLGLILIRIL